MAIKIITGEPGSGKSYYAVNQVISKYFEWNDKLDEWQFKKDKDGNEQVVTIFTNVSGLVLPHIDFETYMEERKLSVHDFFTVSYMRKVAEKYGTIVFLIDECQAYFPDTFRERKDVLNSDDYNYVKENSVFYFFQWHRHIVPDIWMITQEWISVAPKITKLTEFEIKAQVRTLSAIGEFKYFFMKGRVVLDRKILKPNKKIFALYQSFEVEDKSTKINPIRKLAIIAVVIFASVIGIFSWFVGSFVPEKPAIAAPGPGNEIVNDKPVSTRRPAPIAAAQAGGRIGRPALTIPERFVSVQTGGLFFDDNLIAVDWFGSIIPVGDFPYSIKPHPERRRVTVYAPENEVLQVRRLHVASVAADISRAAQEMERENERND